MCLFYNPGLFHLVLEIEQAMRVVRILYALESIFNTPCNTKRSTVILEYCTASKKHYLDHWVVRSPIMPSLDLGGILSISLMAEPAEPLVDPLPCLSEGSKKSASKAFVGSLLT